MKKLLTIVIFLFCAIIFAQTDYKNDSIQLRKIYSEALTKGRSYQWLEYLSKNIGGRLAGSEADKKAVAWGKSELEKLGLDAVWLQPVMVPHWERGAKEEAHIETRHGTFPIDICALGGSIATPEKGILAEVIEVQSIKEVEELGDKVKGKIVFYNRPMPPTTIETFRAYGATVDQRYNGARIAGKHGAVAAIVRSMNLKIDQYPHTGSMSYGDNAENLKIPTAAISTNSAEVLHSFLKEDKIKTKFYFKQSCKTLADAQSHNVIGEIKGSKYPNEIIVVGGHLDSWDLGDGSHDDGAGIVQSMEVLRLFKRLKIRPKRTLRVVLFANEENGLKGGLAYASVAKKKKNFKHIVALESDSGGFTPRGFGFTCSDANYEHTLQWKKLFEPYNIRKFTRGGGGADIGPLKNDTIVLLGLRPDSQRYFDYHHAATDTFEAINKRELELGAATMASIIYLFDKYGIK